MGIWEGLKRRATVKAVETRRLPPQPFAEIERYRPLSGCDLRLYAALREAIPIIDAAICKMIRLTSGFSLEGETEEATAALRAFGEEVRVGGAGTGLAQFVNTYLSELMTYGNAVGEILPAPDGRGVAALYNTALQDVEIVEAQGGAAARVCVRDETGQPKDVAYPQLVVFSALNPPAGRVTGQSILSGLPFVSSILLRIYQTVGRNWERAGNVRFAVTYKPQNDVLDKAYAKERAMAIAKEWQQAMREDTPRDFVAVGDVSVRAIGADNQILDSSVPVRQLLEQIVAKLGVPPYLLGLSWSSTERMSSDQADILTSELESYRRILTPVIRRIASLHLRLGNLPDGVTVRWVDINLRDELSEAQAALYRAQAEALRKQEGLAPERSE